MIEITFLDEDYQFYFREYKKLNDWKKEQINILYNKIKENKISIEEHFNLIIELEELYQIVNKRI